MKTNEVRNYLLYDRSATDLKGMKLVYLQAQKMRTGISFYYQMSMMIYSLH